VCFPWLFAGLSAAPGTPAAIRAWQMESGATQSLDGHFGSIYCLRQGGQYLFSGGEDMGPKLWTFQESTWVPLVELQKHSAQIQAMEVASAAETLVTADRGGVLNCYGYGETNASPAPLFTINTAHTAALMSLNIVNEGDAIFLVTAGLDGHVKVWSQEGELKYDQAVTNQNNQPSGVTSLAMVPENTPQGEQTVMVTACDDKALKLWAMPAFDRRGILASRVGHMDVVRCLAKGPGFSFFSGSMDSKIIVWEFQ